MISDGEKKAVFKLWDKLGISVENLKYLGLGLKSPKEYFFLMQEYLGLPVYGVGSNRAELDALREYIIKDVNEYIKSLDSSDVDSCGNSQVILKHLFLERAFSFMGFAGNHFKVNSDFFCFGDDFVCPDENFGDELFCQFEYCFSPIIGQAVRYVLKKYGIPLNVEWFKFEGNAEEFLPHFSSLVSKAKSL